MVSLVNSNKHLRINAHSSHTLPKDRRAEDSSKLSQQKSSLGEGNNPGLEPLGLKNKKHFSPVLDVSFPCEGGPTKAIFLGFCPNFTSPLLPNRHIDLI